MDNDGKLHRHTVSKSGFKTKRDAINALPTISAEQRKERRKKKTLLEVYTEWLPTHKAGKSTIDCYKAVIKQFQPLYNVPLAEIDIDDLQECLDECPKGKRTKENMRAVIGLVYKYAIPRHQASMNMAQYMVINAEAGEKRQGLPISDLEKN